MAEQERQARECVACDVVMVVIGVLVAGLVAYMSADLATGGRLSAWFSRTARLASVTELRPGDDAAS